VGGGGGRVKIVVDDVDFFRSGPRMNPAQIPLYF